MASLPNHTYRTMRVRDLLEYIEENGVSLDALVRVSDREGDHDSVWHDDLNVGTDWNDEPCLDVG